MKIYTHRGESNFASENTLKSFYLADFLEDDGIECDIRRTKDGVIVINHDMTINRTSNGIGLLKDINYYELIKYNFGTKKNFERIITLDEYLYLFSKKNILMYIEIKEEGYEEDIVNIIKRYISDKITLISFNYNILKNIRKINNEIKLAWLVFDFNKSIEIKSKEINLNEILCPSLCLNKKKIKEIKDNNFKVGAWSVMNIKELDKLKSIGVDDIIWNSGYLGKKYLGEI